MHRKGGLHVCPQHLHLHTYKFTSGGLVEGCEALEDSSYEDIKVATLRSISVPVLSGSKAVCLIVGGPVITTLRIRVIERKKILENAQQMLILWLSLYMNFYLLQILCNGKVCL